MEACWWQAGWCLTMQRIAASHRGCGGLWGCSRAFLSAGLSMSASTGKTPGTPPDFALHTSLSTAMTIRASASPVSARACASASV